MDDPISALDPTVRKKLFKRAFTKLLERKTRVLVTHAIDFIHLADHVIVMREGRIEV
jgi:ABC-type proline/glycine betaine transport system ATPase subunit